MGSVIIFIFWIIGRLNVSFSCLEVSFVKVKWFFGVSFVFMEFFKFLF